jgi:hypothetical protein
MGAQVNGASYLMIGWGTETGDGGIVIATDRNLSLVVS